MKKNCRWSEMSQRRMSEEKFKGLVIKILSIEVAEVSVILVGLLINVISDWENIASRKDQDGLLNRSILKSRKQLYLEIVRLLKKLTQELNVFIKTSNSIFGSLQTVTIVKLREPIDNDKNNVSK